MTVQQQPYNPDDEPFDWSQAGWERPRCEYRSEDESESFPSYCVHCRDVPRGATLALRPSRWRPDDG